MLVMSSSSEFEEVMDIWGLKESTSYHWPEDNSLYSSVIVADLPQESQT